MKPIVVDRSSHKILRERLASRSVSRDIPVRWHEFVDRLSRDSTGTSAAAGHWRQALTGSAQLLSWHMTPETILTALGGGDLVYLCWGVPPRASWKDSAVKMVLKRARMVLVNDETTRDEVRAIAGRSALIVPYFIDTEYFEFKPLQPRPRFLFSSGNIDRDPEVLVALAEHGYPVKWLVNDPEARARYENRHPNLTCVSRLDDESLRALYQTCAAVVSPTFGDRHAAGQTTGMEAIACGAPLLISSGRTAKIFSDMPSVREIQSPRDWVGAVDRHLSDGGLAAFAMDSSTRLRNRCGYAPVVAEMTALLSSRNDRRA